MYLWPSGTWFSEGLGSIRLMVGLDGLRSLFQHKQFHEKFPHMNSTVQQKKVGLKFPCETGRKVTLVFSEAE